MSNAIIELDDYRMDDYDIGYDVGYDDGYDDGYAKAREDAKKRAMQRKQERKRKQREIWEDIIKRTMGFVLVLGSAASLLLTNMDVSYIFITLPAGVILLLVD